MKERRARRPSSHSNKTPPFCYFKVSSAFEVSAISIDWQLIELIWAIRYSHHTYIRSTTWCVCWQSAGLHCWRCTSKRPCRDDWLCSSPDAFPPIRSLNYNQADRKQSKLTIKRSLSQWKFNQPIVDRVTVSIKKTWMINEDLQYCWPWIRMFRSIV